ncbi:Alb1-domain-containing protein [Podospora australis]|uniref:Alb1-domain-containing protein n=1 Tax=Podospora australis TaxID=1536484 RepID=A0AAN6X367_9PEZI|nr:Alb1-domain-containing protein [Podospora australis]
MAKPTIDKGKKGPSKHSRAARRDVPIDINTDKSLKEARAPQQSVDYRPAVLAAHHTGGVTKKKSGRKAVLSAKARKRQEKSMDKAEAIMERTQTKVQKSKASAKVIDVRRKPWEQINDEVYGTVPVKKLSKKQQTKAEEDAMVAEFYADDDGNVEMEGAAETEETAVASLQAQSIPVSRFAAEDEEIL